MIRQFYDGIAYSVSLAPEAVPSLNVGSGLIANPQTALVASPQTTVTSAQQDDNIAATLPVMQPGASPTLGGQPTATWIAIAIAAIIGGVLLSELARR